MPNTKKRNKERKVFMAQLLTYPTEQQQIQMNTKRDEELIAYLKGREEILKNRALEELAQRIRVKLD
jgi:hypothetical protein